MEYVFFMDGDRWCCTLPDFVNLQESPAGFGDTKEAAQAALLADLASVRKWSLR